MELILLACFATLAILLLTGVSLLLLRELRAQAVRAAEAQAGLLAVHNDQQARQLAQSERLVQLARSADPMTYSALVGVTTASGYDGPAYDPSDDAEMKRLAGEAENPIEEPLNEHEQSFLTEAGIDPFSGF